MNNLSHIDDKGQARMVDVSGKSLTLREARAQGSVTMRKETLRMVSDGKVPKGDVFATARIAGIMAAKKTPDIIPLCHPLNIASISIDFVINEKESRIDILSCVRLTGQTGVEMEALTAVSAAALTIYDMCKAVDRGMVISGIFLAEKSGGKSGHYKR